MPKVGQAQSEGATTVRPHRRAQAVVVLPQTAVWLHPTDRPSSVVSRRFNGPTISVGRRSRYVATSTSAIVFLFVAPRAITSS